MSTEDHLYTYRELTAYGDKCANHVLKGVEHGILACLGWTAVLAGVYLFFHAEDGYTE